MPATTRPLEAYPALTGLRGLFCLWVFFLHVAMILQEPARQTLDAVIGPALASWCWAGYLAVDGFFILSGFVLCHRYADGLGQVGRYLWSRWTRIFPLHLCILAVIVGVVWGAGLHADRPAFPEARSDPHPAFATPDLIKQVFLVQAWDWFPRLTWTHASWSISAEWAMYLCFPILLPLSQRLAPWLAGLLAAGLMIGLAVLLAHLEPARAMIDDVAASLPRSTAMSDDILARISPSAFEFGLLRAAAGFTTGCCLHRLSAALGGRFRPAQADLLALATCIAIAGICIMAPVIYALPLLPLLIIALTRSGGIVHGLCSCRPLLAIGDWSYAVYLLHVPLLMVLAPAFDGASSATTALVLLGATVLVLLLAWLTDRFVDRPLRMRLRGTRPARQAAAD